MIRALQLTIFAILGIAVVGCGSGDNEPVPDELVFYSLAGNDRDEDIVPQDKEQFHGILVLGKTTIADADKRRKIMKSLAVGIANSSGPKAACFWPRHGIRTVEGGQTIDYVICFECTQFERFVGGEKTLDFIAKFPEAEFDQLLTEAGLPIAPKGRFPLGKKP
jgi:hypothetical protein